MSDHEGIPIFFVIGSTGEYEDYHEWVVCAYRDEKSAHDHAKRANEEAYYISCDMPRDGRTIFHKSELDENMHIDYSGTTYCVEQTVLYAVFRG